jgi:uncharacterized protein
VSTFFIIDTNVVVAGLLTAQADSPVARILDGMLSAAFPFVVSEALLAEYRAVLVRPKLCKLHGQSETEVDAVLTDMVRHAIVLAPVSTEETPKAPDAGDQFLWNLLATRLDLVLVTGDKLLLQDEGMQWQVILPQAFVGQFLH